MINKNSNPNDDITDFSFEDSATGHAEPGASPSPQLNTPPPSGPEIPRPNLDLARFGTGFKLLLMFLLTLGFLIPLSMLSDLTRERQERRAEAASEVSQAWAGELRLSAPIIIIPCDYRYRDDQDREATGTRHVILYPEQVAIEATLDPQLRQRGIFSIPLFTMQSTLSGQFQRPSLQALGSDVIRAHWDQAYLAVLLPDYRSLAESPTITLGDRDFKLDSPRPDMLLSGAALTCNLPDSDWDGLTTFNLQLKLKGSDSLTILAMAKSTTAHISSSWAHPSFFGTALPETRTVGDAGLDATWRIVRYGQGPSATAVLDRGLIDTRALQGYGSDDLSENFGIRLYQSNSIYQLTDRSLKYGILFIIIPFVALFLFEAMRRIRVHPVQYLLIGVVNCLFFLLLLALSEHLDFNLSYVAAALAVIILAGLYSSWILPERRDGLIMAGLLASLYGYMFVALQSEDYALLIGSLGLVGTVASVMIATRKIDWYAIGKRSKV